MLKTGHFLAITCALLALGSGLFVYWDLRDGIFYERGIYLPIVFGTMALAFLLFPGEPKTFRDMALNTDPARVDGWAANAPALHKRVWLGSAAVSFALGTVAVDYLKGEDVLTAGELAQLAFFGLLFFFVFRWVGRRKGY